MAMWNVIFIEKLGDGCTTFLCVASHNLYNFVKFYKIMSKKKVKDEKKLEDILQQRIFSEIDEMGQVFNKANTSYAA